MDETLYVIAHEIAHILLGEGHPDQGGGAAPLLGTATEFRLMATIDKKRVAETIDDGLLVKKEWDEAEKWLESNLEEEGQ